MSVETKKFSNARLLFVALLNLFLVACAAVPHQSSNYTSDDIFREQVKRYPYIKLASRAVPEGIAEFKNLTYIQRGARDLQLDLYAPGTTMDELRPGIVLVHGGDWLGGEREHLTSLAINLALRGYVVATIDYRLASQAPYPAAVEDAQAAVRWMREHAEPYGIDSSHIALGGAGAGGVVAALAGLTAVELAEVQVILNLDGPWQLDPATLKSETGHPDPIGNWLGGEVAKQGALLHQASPVNLVRKDMPAVFLLNSGEPSYRAGQDEMLRRLAHFRVPHRVEEIPGSPHAFWLFEPWVSPTANITADFLDLQFKYRMTCH